MYQAKCVLTLLLGDGKSTHTHSHTHKAKVRNRVKVAFFCNKDSYLNVTLSTPHVVQLIYAAHIYLRNIRDDTVNKLPSTADMLGFQGGFKSFFSNVIQLQPTRRAPHFESGEKSTESGGVCVCVCAWHCSSTTKNKPPHTHSSLLLLTASPPPFLCLVSVPPSLAVRNVFM